MKKFMAIIVSAVMMLSLIACGNDAAGTEHQSSAEAEQEQVETVAAQENETTEESTVSEESIAAEEGTGTEESTDTTEVETDEAEEDTTEVSSIVVYFSWSGNTRTIAEEIQSQTGADLFELTPVTPYSTDYNTVLDEAQAEQRANARPEINGIIDNFEQYDMVYLGYPNWWGDMPMIIYSFLDDYDLSGKTIVPFVSSGGSGFSNSLTTIAGMEPEATLTEGLSLSSSASANPGDRVSEWLASLNLE